MTARKKSPVVPIFFSRPACRVSTFQGVETRHAGVFVFSARMCVFRAFMCFPLFTELLLRKNADFS